MSELKKKDVNKIIGYLINLVSVNRVKYERFSIERKRIIYELRKRCVKGGTITMIDDKVKAHILQLYKEGKLVIRYDDIRHYFYTIWIDTGEVFYSDDYYPNIWK